jgi:hypothetical protein
MANANMISRQSRVCVLRAVTTPHGSDGQLHNQMARPSMCALSVRGASGSCPVRASSISPVIRDPRQWWTPRMVVKLFESL